MFSRSWCAAIALGLIVWAAAGSAQQGLRPQPDSHKTTANPDNNGQQPIVSAIASALDRIEALVREAIPKQDQETEKRKEEREKDDLKAQKEMSLWAFWMFVATCATVIISLSGLALIARTLHHTRRAADYAKAMVKEAEDATAAAKEAVAVTRESAEKQLRAYVSIDTVDPISILKGFPPAEIAPLHNYRNRKLAILLRIKNFGQTPAFNFRYTTGVFLSSWPIEIDRVIGGPKNPFYFRSSMSLAPGDTLVEQIHTDDVLDDATINDVVNNKTFIVVWAAIRYKDAFGIERHTNICRGTSYGMVHLASSNYRAQQHNDAS